MKISSAFSLTVTLTIPNVPGSLAKITTMIGQMKASFAEVYLLSRTFHEVVRRISVVCYSEAHMGEVLKALQDLDFVKVLDWQDDVLDLHRGGKISTLPKRVLNTSDDLAQAYTPGVARVCNLIAEKPETAYSYTLKGNTIAIVSDGSAVLGLGDIGPTASLPVMEGKAMLFKQFANLDAFPICLNTKDTQEIIDTIKAISPSFGGINLEDISAPRCFEIEEKLQEQLDIPVFHDDQHGTACVVLAGLLNALKLANKKIQDIKIVVNGFGAGGIACTRMLLDAGAKYLIGCDSQGIISKDRQSGLNAVKLQLLEHINPHNETGNLATAMKDADVFIGVSKPNVLTKACVQSMASKPIVFALANPDPEITPEEIEDTAFIIATGRSDYANQINNVLCFPGIMRGAIDARVPNISAKMKLAAANAIANAIPEKDLRPDYIIPNPFNLEIPRLVADRVREAARS